MNMESKNQWMTHILALLITLGFFGSFLLTCFFDISDIKKQIIDIMTGILGGAFTCVISYYFGTSAGSRMKDNILLKKGDSNE